MKNLIWVELSLQFLIENKVASFISSFSILNPNIIINSLSNELNSQTNPLVLFPK